MAPFINMMKFTIITLFPEMFEGPLSCSILKRAQEKGSFEVNFINLRDFGIGPRKQVDDTPYGGGAGMVLRVDVTAKAIEKAKEGSSGAKVILLTPQGSIFNQKMVQKLSLEKEIIFICGHYEGFDERIRKLVDMEVSVGQYILTGGEIATMTIIDCIARLLPGTLGSKDSVQSESFVGENLIEYPQFTRPNEWRGEKVPETLLSGNHSKIDEWRQKMSKQKSKNYKKLVDDF